MNSIEQAKNLIDRAKNLQEFEVIRIMPEDFRFSGPVPFDMEIYGNQMYIKVFAVSLEEAIHQADSWLGI